MNVNRESPSGQYDPRSDSFECVSMRAREWLATVLVAAGGACAGVYLAATAIGTVLAAIGSPALLRLSMYVCHLACCFWALPALGMFLLGLMGLALKGGSIGIQKVRVTASVLLIVGAAAAFTHVPCKFVNLFVTVNSDVATTT